jgi:Chromo (CHRromatin Organisation MOdifier) domain
LDNKHYSPFTILEKIGTSSYKLQLPLSWSCIHNVFNEVLLLLFTPPTFPSQQPPSPTPPIEVAGNIKYEVESIQNSRWKQNQLEYLVHWKGWPDEDDTWEPKGNLLNAQESINDFHTLYPKAIR